MALRLIGEHPSGGSGCAESFPADVVGAVTVAGQTPADRAAKAKKGSGRILLPRPKTNQDCAGCSLLIEESGDPAALFIVCDGHGGNGDQARSRHTSRATPSALCTTTTNRPDCVHGLPYVCTQASQRAAALLHSELGPTVAALLSASKAGGAAATTGQVKQAFGAVDAAMLTDGSNENSGCTALCAVCVVPPSGGTAVVWTAHVGDSRAVLGSRSDAADPLSALSVRELTMDHKPDLPEEQRRIESQGGI
eukprot:1429507-Prymnesium_polylepis.1